MPVTLYERKGSQDFSRGPGQPGEGKILFVAFGAESQDEALFEAENDDRAPPLLNGYLRGKGSVEDQGGDIYFVDFQYTRAIPNEAQPGAGQTPPDSRPHPDNENQIGRDMSFSTGGATRHIKFSKATRYKASRDQGNFDTAPDFQKLIGVDLKTGEIHGCDVLAPSADFTITKRFRSLTLGWFRAMVDKIATQNKVQFLGMEAGEVLFKGADGQYKDGDQVPWTVTGRFGYSRNMTLERNPDDCTFRKDVPITVPDIQGWNYVWVIPEVISFGFTENGVQKQTKVSVPRWVYVERVYDEADHNNLGFN